MNTTPNILRWAGRALACGTLTFAAATYAGKPVKPPPTPSGPAYVAVSLGGLLDSSGRLVNRPADLNNVGQVVGNTVVPGTTGQQAYLINPLDGNGDGQPDTWFLDANSDGQNDLIIGLGGPSSACAVNDAGQVVGLVVIPGDAEAQVYLLDPRDTNNDGRPDRWFEDLDNDSFNDLMVPLGRPPGLGTSYQLWGPPDPDVNNLGQVIATYSDTNGVSPPLGFLLTPQVDANGVRHWFVDDGSGANALWVPLGTFRPIAINDKGQIAGQTQSGEAALLNPDGTLIALRPPACTYSLATTINNRGQIGITRVVDTGAPTPNEYAGLLTPLDTNNDGIPDTWYRDANGDGVNDLIVDLGTYKRMEISLVYTHGLNEVGAVLGGSVSYAQHFSTQAAWLWQNGVLQGLQDLAGVQHIQFAYAINNAGQIICYVNTLGVNCILLPAR